jgi:hypothetical protein
VCMNAMVKEKMELVIILHFKIGALFESDFPLRNRILLLEMHIFYYFIKSRRI